MVYELKHIDDDKMAEHLEKMKWLKEVGDYNKTPAPLTEIPQQVYIDVIRRETPLYRESRQLLDRVCIESDFRAAIIYWFEDCGIMMLLPENLGNILVGDPAGKAVWDSVRKIIGIINYFWIGCRHTYETSEISNFAKREDKVFCKIKTCQLCGHVKEIPI